MKALSVRQPWAWLIVHGHKPVENRNWRTKHRGLTAIHASKGMTNEEYEYGLAIAASQGVTIPDKHALERGGFVGTVVITDCVTECDSPYFFGKYGFMLAEPRPAPFIPYKGKLSLFTIEPGVINAIG